MSNEYYNASSAPATSSHGSSSIIRAEFAAIQAGMDKMPVLSTKSGMIVGVNAGGTGLEAKTAASVRAAIDVPSTADLVSKAPLNSPTFTGDPKAPTPAALDNDTSIATTEFCNLYFLKLTGGSLIGSLSATGQILSTQANNTATGNAQFYLNGATGNRIDFNNNGIAPPSFTTRSVGTKLMLYSFLTGSSTDFAFGVDLDVFWTSVPSSTQSYKWYAATTSIATLSGVGDFTVIGQKISTKAWDATDGKGQFFLNGTTANRIDFNSNGVAPPTFTTRSAGTKIVFNALLGASTVDYAFGIDSAVFWQSVPDSARNFKWYAGTTNIASLTGAGIFTAQGVLANTATGGVGFTTGAGGTVTQATSKATTVTLNKACGNITLNAASLAAGAVVTFTFLNSSIGSADNMILNPVSGTDGAYLLTLSAVGAGTCNISIRNLTAGALAEGFIIRFSIISGVTA